MDNDEGFQSEPEVILIDTRENDENGEKLNDIESSEENDENEAPSNEQNENDSDEVQFIKL